MITLTHWVPSFSGFLSLLDSWNGNFEFDYEEENDYDNEEDDDDAYNESSDEECKDVL